MRARAFYRIIKKNNAQTIGFGGKKKSYNDNNNNERPRTRRYTRLYTPEKRIQIGRHVSFSFFFLPLLRVHNNNDGGGGGVHNNRRNSSTTWLRDCNGRNRNTEQNGEYTYTYRVLSRRVSDRTRLEGVQSGNLASHPKRFLEIRVFDRFRFFREEHIFSTVVALFWCLTHYLKNELECARVFGKHVARSVVRVSSRRRISHNRIKRKNS